VPSSQSPLSWPARSCVLLLLVLAVWLRLDGYPNTYFADELIPRAVVQHMRDSGTLDTRWDRADWRGDYAGHFYKLPQYNFSSYHTALLPMLRLAHAAGQADVPDLVVYRMASLLFQLGGFVLVFALARQMLGGWGGVAALAWLTVMPQAVVDAHYARPESFVMLLAALAAWLAWQVHVTGRQRLLLPEAVVWGIACACKFSFLPMAALALLAQLWRWRRVQAAMFWLGGFAGGIALSAPYILLDGPGFVRGVQLLLTQYAPAPGDAGWLPSAHQLLPYLAAFFGPVLLLLPLSLLASRCAVRCFALLALAVSAAYLLLFARQGVFFERNLSHLLPLWAVLFAIASQALWSWQPVAIRAAVPLLLVLLLAWPLWLSWRISEDFFCGLPAVHERVAAHERDLATRFSGASVQSPSLFAGLQVVDGIAPGDILRVPQHKLAGLQQVHHSLQLKGFVLVDELVLPLAFLPYNQLQINHFPPAYGYYRRVAPAAGVPR
jgi:hypothetical protein